MRRCLLGFVAAAATLGLVAAQSPDRLILTNAKLLDLAAGRVRPVAAVVVEGSKIAAIHAEKPAQPLEGTSIRDLGGAVLVPALADLSMQTLPGLDIDVDYFYALSLAHGVMYARVVDSNLPWGVAQRSRVSSGDILAPRVWTSGPLLDMRTPLGARNQAVIAGGLLPVVRVPDAASLGREVARQAEQKVDWIHLGENVPPDALRAAVAAARRAKVLVSVAPMASSMSEAAVAGTTLLDVLGMPLQNLADPQGPARGKPGAPPPSPVAPAVAVETAWAQTTDADRRALIATLKRTGVAVAPMLTQLEIQRGALADVDRDLAFLPERLRSPIQGRFVAGGQGSGDVRSKARANQQWFLREFVKAGGKLVAATGTQSDGWPIPGVGVHREMGLLVECGLTPLDAIKAAAVSGAEALGVRQPGTWRVGTPADFIVVKSDPTQDIGQMANIVLAVRAGEVLDRDQLLKLAARAIRKR